MVSLKGHHRLYLLEWSQGQSMLAFAVSVSGPNNGFPALLGVSVRSQLSGIVDLIPHEVKCSGILVCLVEHPEKLGSVDPKSYLHHRGEITFALWRDNTYRDELARIPWCKWTYANLGSLNPSYRVDPCTATNFEHCFESMRKRFSGEPFWVARRLNET